MPLAKLQHAILTWLDTLASTLARTGMKLDFARFCIVGSLGFCWDTSTVYGLRHFIGLYAAGVAGFFIAATANWAVNRVWTFKDKKRDPAHRQWAKFLTANFAGFILNRGSFFAIITYSAFCRREPVFPIIFGSFAGLAVNYFLSKRFVFK